MIKIYLFKIENNFVYYLFFKCGSLILWINYKHLFHYQHSKCSTAASKLMHKQTEKQKSRVPPYLLQCAWLTFSVVWTEHCQPHWGTWKVLLACWTDFKGNRLVNLMSSLRKWLRGIHVHQRLSCAPPPKKDVSSGLITHNCMYTCQFIKPTGMIFRKPNFVYVKG